MTEAEPFSAARVLREACGACHKCVSLLTGRNSAADREEAPPGGAACRICLGIATDFAESSPPPPLAREMAAAALSYGGLGPNPLAAEPPTATVPAALMVRALAAACAVERAAVEASAPTPEGSVLGRLLAPSAPAGYYDAIKEMVRGAVSRELTQVRGRVDGNAAGGEGAAPPYPFADVTPEMKREEAGYLGIHVLIVPLSSAPSEGGVGCDDFILPPSETLPLYAESRRKERKRFRGNDPTKKQGGDPRVNLMKRVRAQTMGGSNGAWNAERSDVQRVLEQVSSAPGTRQALADWIVGLKGLSSGEPSYSIHATVWRKPFYVGGKYTKASRNVSQTPFYVPDGPRGAQIRKGQTSVEEEICPVLAEVGCGGISQQNNEEPAANQTPEVTRNTRGKVVYGMCKFHASGREDMDVRMLLPAVPRLADESKVGGRPFVCEIIDAHKVPTPQDLRKVLYAINHSNEKTENTFLEVSDILVDAGIGDFSSSAANGTVKRRYGQNPNGVDIASLSYRSHHHFRNLQGETETKIKHYGCAVWCERRIQSQEELDRLLGVHDGRYPLQIHQSTPLRVLHRRAAAVRTRHILSLTARLVNDHWFALHLSTSAGTYVKESVYGDCGRTNPNVSSMLNCKTDITQLDCEGIQL